MYESIPPHTKEALDRYAKDKIPTGSFLYAVLTNNLFEAVRRADIYNIGGLPVIVSYIYNELPSACRGSKEIVERWLNSKAKN